MNTIEKSIQLNTSQQYELDFFSNGEKLLRHLNERDTNYSIYFISMEMTDIDGIVLAQQIRSFDLDALIIFLSDNIQRMPEVFKVQTFDYLVKPISHTHLLDTMIRAKKHFNASHAYFEFSFNRQFVVLAMNEIVYIVKSGRIAYIHTTEKIYKTYLTMADITAKLNKDSFARIHGSYVVNLHYIVEIMKNEVFIRQFEDGIQKENTLSLPISRTFKEELKNTYAIFLRSGKS